MKTLKRVALIIVAMLICAGSADAKILSFGLKAGLNVNKLHFNKSAIEDLTTNSNSAGWEAGVMVEANVPIIGLGFDLSLMYARMNNSSLAIFQNTNDNTVTPFDGKDVGKNFIMIPINVKYKFNLPVVSNYLVPYIFTGPDFAFRLNKHTFNDMKTRTCQVAWNVGLGIELVKHLQIGASYGFGINNVAEKVFKTNTSELKVKNNYWTVTAAWLF